jgi:hypothetical protein
MVKKIKHKEKLRKGIEEPGVRGCGKGDRRKQMDWPTHES